MALNPYSNPSEQKILPYNTDLIAGLAEYNQKRYDTSAGEYDDLLGSFNKIPALEQDVPRRKETVDKYRNQLDAVYKQSQGDYTKMLPALKRLKNAYQNDVAYGQIGAIIGQYNNAAAYNKQVDEALSKGIIDSITASKLKEDANKRYKGIGDPNEFGQFSGIYQGRTPAKYLDPYELGDKLIKGWEAEKEAREGVRFHTDEKGRRYIINSKGNKEWVNRDEIKQHLIRMFNQNPELKASIDQQTFLDNYGIDEDSEIYGNDQHGNEVQINPNAYLNNYKNRLIENPANFIADKYGYLRTDSGITGIKDDPYTLKGYEEDANQHAPIPGNLPSVRIPQNDNLKVHLPFFNEGSDRREFSKEEKTAIYKKYGIDIDSQGRASMASNPAGYQAAAAEIAAGIVKSKDDKPAKINFSAEQKEILDRAEEEYGWKAGTDESKAKLINRFIDYQNDKLTYPGFEQVNEFDPKAVTARKNAQQIYFGEDGLGGGYTNNTFKLISGEGEKVLTGKEVSKKYGKNRKQITGNISPDNFVTPRGYLVSIQDDNGEEIAKYALETPASSSDKVKHILYQAKYNVTGKSILPVTDEDGKTHNFTVKYRDKSESLSDNSTHAPNVIGNYVEIYEPGNPKPIARADSETSQDIFIDAYMKAVQALNK